VSRILALSVSYEPYLARFNAAPEEVGTAWAQASTR